MSGDLIITLIPLVGSAIGTLGGIMLSNKLITYRIEQLEKRVGEHNNVVTRTFKLETANAVFEEKLKDVDEKISSLKERK